MGCSQFCACFSELLQHWSYISMNPVCTPVWVFPHVTLSHFLSLIFLSTATTQAELLSFNQLSWTKYALACLLWLLCLGNFHSYLESLSIVVFLCYTNFIANSNIIRRVLPRAAWHRKMAGRRSKLAAKSVLHYYIKWGLSKIPNIHGYTSLNWIALHFFFSSLYFVSFGINTTLAASHLFW